MEHEPIDSEKWKTARNRVYFRNALYIYLAVNLFLWFVWYMSLNEQPIQFRNMWPLWSTLGWGLGIYFMYLHAYKSKSKEAIQKEYEKIKSGK